MPKDEPTAEELVWNASSPHSQEKVENPLGWGGGVASPPAIGGLTLNEMKLLVH